SGYLCRRRSGRHPGWLLSRVWGCFPTTCGFVLGPWFRRVLPCLLLFWRSVVLLCLVVRGIRSSQTRPGLVLLVRCGWLWVLSGYLCRRRSGRHPGWLLSRVWGCFPTTCGFVLGPWFRRVLPCLLLFWRSVVLLCLVVRGIRSSQTRPGLVLLVRCGWLWVVSQCSLSEPPNRTARPPTPLGPGVLL